MAFQAPFRKMYTAVGDLTDGIQTVHDLKLRISYSECGTDRAEGTLVGRREQAKLVRKIVSSSEAEFSGIWRQTGVAYEIAFKVKGFLLMGRFQGAFETDELCRFDCRELEIRQVFSGIPPEGIARQSVKTTFAIPYRRELVVPHLPREFEGEIPGFVPYLSFQTDIGELRIEARTHSGSATFGSNDGTFCYSELCMTFATEPDRYRNDGEEQIQRIADDYLALISFITQTRTQFYRKDLARNFHEDGLVESTSRHFYRKEYQAIERARLIEWQHTNAILREAMPKYQGHQAKREVSESIDFFLAGVHSSLLEAKLIWLQAAIEIVTNSMRRQIELSSEKCDHYGKEKKRLRDKIVEVVAAFKVGMEDLYPTVLEDKDRTFPFINFRNDIVHGRSREIDRHELSAELYRQQILLERMIFHWIGMDARKVVYLGLPSIVLPF